MNRNTIYKLKTYYNNKQIRILINIIYVLNQLLLAIYLLFIPIQIAYFWKLKIIQNGSIQNSIDIGVLIFFIIHILLYIDDKMYQWLKSPYTKWYKILITLQLFYDILCIAVALYSTIIYQQTIQQRAIQLIFFFKIYKLVQFDRKCMFIAVGTWFYTYYKILRTTLVVFMAISYIGSMFYGIAYYLLITGVQYQFLLWIVSAPAIQDCVDQSFIIQLEYAIYWALGTASTAAYGDISAAQPTLVLFNILALAFQGFLFGYYLNTMHSIPMENKQQQAQLLQKFDAFQQYCANRNISKKLYLQILCSLQYTETHKKKLESIQKLMPQKYMQQIKANIYYDFISDPTFFGDSHFQLVISQKIKNVVCEIDQDVYQYRDVNRDDLLYVKQGSINCYFKSQMKFISLQKAENGNCFGVYGFVSGLLIKQRAFCTNYCSIYKLARLDYKSLLPNLLKIKFNELQIKSYSFQGLHFQREPIIKVIYQLEQNDSQYPFLNYNLKSKLILRIYNTKQLKRTRFYRQHRISKKIKPCQKLTKDVEVQTEQFIQNIYEIVYIWQKGNQSQFKNTYNFN